MNDFTSRIIEQVLAQRSRNDVRLEGIVSRISHSAGAGYEDDVADAVRLMQHNDLLMRIAEHLHKKEDQSLTRIWGGSS